MNEKESRKDKAFRLFNEAYKNYLHNSDDVQLKRLYECSASVLEFGKNAGAEYWIEVYRRRTDKQRQDALSYWGY